MILGFPKMQEDNNEFPAKNPEILIDRNSVSPAFHPEDRGQSSRNSEAREEEFFYEKLRKLHESSGLILDVGVGETALDLFMFYKEVTTRGGYERVSKDGRWAEVASALNLTNKVPNSCLHLPGIYANLLYQFELIYIFGMPGESSAALDTPSDTGALSTKKRKHIKKCYRVEPGIHIGNTIVGIIETEFDSGYLITAMVGSEKLTGLLYLVQECAGEQFAVIPSLIDGVGLEDSDSEPVGLQIRVGTAENNPSVHPLPRNKKAKKKDPNAPLGLRSAYQIFLSKECNRLKKMHGRSSGGSIRRMAIDAWKCLSEFDRRPYIEDSQRDKERYEREMVAYNRQWNMQTGKKENRAYNPEASIYDDYHVSLQTDVEPDKSLVPNESMIEFAVQLMEKARRTDPTILVGWDDYGSLDIPT